MIKTFRHKGLKRLFESDNVGGVGADQVKRLRMFWHTWTERIGHRISTCPLHALKGELKGRCSVTISGNWRVVFSFESGDAFDVDPVDYH